MAISVERTLYIPYSRGDTKYFTDADSGVYVQAPITLFNTVIGASKRNSNVYVYMSDTAKDELFPNSVAQPYKYDHITNGGATATANYIEFLIDGTVQFKDTGYSALSGVVKSHTDVPISGCSKSSKIGWHLYTNGGWLPTPSIGYNTFEEISFHYWVYEFAAKGIQVKVTSNSSYVDTSDNEVNFFTGAGTLSAIATKKKFGFDGDTITFSTTDTGFEGWYQDEDFTQLVSTSSTYVHTVNGSDLVLYAKTSTAPTTGLWIKRNGQWTLAKRAFMKENGIWVEKTELEDLANMFDANYKYFNIDLT